MSRGRKPDALAVRRSRTSPSPVEVEVVPAGAARKPELVAANANLSEMWDVLVGDGAAYTESDVPILTSYVYWFEIAHELEARMLQGGSVCTIDVVEEPDGSLSAASSIAFKQYEKAVSMCLKLANELGGTPIARARLGIAQGIEESVTNNIRDSIVRAVEQMGY